MKVAVYTRDSDGQVRVRRFVDITTGQARDAVAGDGVPIRGYTFRGIVDDLQLPTRTKRDAWTYRTGTRRIEVDPEKEAQLPTRLRG